jgi:hypothetical protein
VERLRTGLLVHRLDRLTRSVADWARLAGAFKRRGTKLVVVAGDIHLGDLAMSDLVLNVLATFAQFEREIIGERLRDARAGLRRRGLRNAGRVPFGYKADPLSHQLVVQAAEAPVVKRIFEMASAGAPPSAIARWINTQGEDNPRALDGRQPWSSKAVLRVLGNRTYLGRMGHVDDAHDPMVDEALFARARATVEGRRTRKPSRRLQQEGDLFLLRRLLLSSLWSSTRRRLQRRTLRSRRESRSEPENHSNVAGRANVRGHVDGWAAPDRSRLWSGVAIAHYAALMRDRKTFESAPDGAPWKDVPTRA